MADSPAVCEYPLPDGVQPVPPAQLVPGPDAHVDAALARPGPVVGDKNIWFFWHSGLAGLPPYARRTVRAWHRRFARQGWTVRVVDGRPGSPLNVARFADVADACWFPRAFADGAVAGPYAAQHTSDLVRWPLLLRHGGVYADVGLLPIGDLDRAWHATVADDSSPCDVLSFNTGGRCLTNYFLAARRANPLFLRCHRLLLELWRGRTTTDGMHASPLLRGLPLMSGAGLSFTENGTTYGPSDIAPILTDYIIQGQVMAMVMGLVDDADGWDGPAYAAKRVYAIDYMVGSQLINHMTAWDGPRQFALLSLPLPAAGEPETDDQRLARRIVEDCLRRSFCFKLAHGLIVRVMGETLGSLWRRHEGADNVPGTYAHWLRHGTAHWRPTEPLPPCQPLGHGPPVKRGPLLEEAGAGPRAGAPPAFDIGLKAQADYSP